MSKTTIQKFSSALPWAILLKVIGALIGFLTSIVIVRGLGPYDYGVLSILSFIFGLISLTVAFGLDRALLRYIPELNVKDKVYGIKNTLLSIIIVQMLVWASILLLIYFTKGLISDMFSMDLEMYLLIGTLLILVSVYGGNFSGVLISLYDFKYVTFISTITGIANILLIVLLLKLNWGIIGILVAGAIASLISIVFYLYILKLRISSKVKKDGRGIELIRILKFSAPLVVSGMLVMITWMQSEVLFLGLFVGAVEVGYFNLAFSLSQQAMAFVPLSIYSLGLISFVEGYTKDRDNLRTAVDLQYKLVYIVVAPISVMGILFADKAVIILYGEQMATAASIIPIFFIIFSISFLGHCTGLVLTTLERTDVMMTISIVVAVINLLFDYIFIKQYGLIGAVIAFFGTIVLSKLIEIPITMKFFAQFRIPLKFIGKCYLATLPILPLALIESYITNIYTLVILSIVGVGLSIIGIKLVGLVGKEEKKIIEISNVPFKKTIIRILG